MIRYAVLISILFVSFSCSHAPDLNEDEESVLKRLQSVCTELKAEGVDRPAQLARLLHGKVVAASEIQGAGFRTARYSKNKNQHEMHVFFSEGADRPILADLTAVFGATEVISESKTSTVLFRLAPEPCKDLYVSAHLWTPKVSPQSPVLSLKIRHMDSPK